MNFEAHLHALFIIKVTIAFLVIPPPPLNTIMMTIGHTIVYEL